MRSMLVAVAVAALALGMITPAAPQPFSDVPGPHWAAVAIVQLAAKGLVEGYPDGTFKGDRAMTRYEMADVVARMLARVDALVNAPRPPAAAPDVTPEDLQLLRALVEELRSELADKRVRIPPLEEEIHALRSRVSNVKITGLFRLRYDEARSATGDPIPGNGNPTTGATGAGSSPHVPLAGLWLKLEFDGFVADNIHMILALDTGGINGGYNILNGAAYGMPAGTAFPQGQFGNIDNMFLDWKNAWGTPLEIWLGRFGGNTGVPGGAASSATLGATFGIHPIQFGPFGLLMNTTGDTWADSSGDSGYNVVDGLALFGHWPDFADLQTQAVITRVVGNTGGNTYFSGEDAYGIDANVRVIFGLRVGAYAVGNNIVNPAGFGAAATPAPNGARWHLYGPGGGSMNPATSNCPVVAGSGIQCPAAGSGFGVYTNWDIVRSFHLDAEIARWSDAVHASSDTGYQLNLTLDAGTLTGAGHNWQFQLGFLNYGPNFYPPYGAAEADINMADVIYPGNVQGVLLTTTFNPVKDNDAWTIYGTYFGGNNISNGQGVSEYEAGVEYRFAPQAQVVFLIRNLTISGIQQIQLYRTDVNYTF